MWMRHPWFVINKIIIGLILFSKQLYYSIYWMSPQLLNSASIASIRYRTCMAMFMLALQIPPTLKHADETIHHLMEDIGDFVVFANNLSLVCTIYKFISKRQRKETNIAHFPHWGLTTLFFFMKIHTLYMTLLFLPIHMIETKLL